MTASAVHLVRHGEVANPHHVVYADLPGYGLSARGHAQATAAAEYLAGLPIVRVLSSPLLRARQTAAPIAAAHGLEVDVDAGLTEWTISMRWAGVRWEDLDDVFPGELTAYLNHPEDLDFAAESLAACGQRVAAVARAAAADADGHVVLVAHQDPIHAGHIELTGQPPAAYHGAKPAHGATLTLRPAPGAWVNSAHWQPDQ